MCEHAKRCKPLFLYFLYFAFDLSCDSHNVYKSIFFVKAYHKLNVYIVIFYKKDPYRIPVRVCHGAQYRRLNAEGLNARHHTIGSTQRIRIRSLACIQVPAISTPARTHITEVVTNVRDVEKVAAMVSNL
jgi:hypothetical protein